MVFLNTLGVDRMYFCHSKILSTGKKVDGERMFTYTTYIQITLGI